MDLGYRGKAEGHAQTNPTKSGPSEPSGTVRGW